VNFKEAEVRLVHSLVRLLGYSEIDETEDRRN
jgi:hypothetical protein